MTRRARSASILRGIGGVVALALAMGIALPLLILFSAALFPPGQVPTAGQWWPSEPSFAALQRAWSLAELGPALALSLLVAGLGAGLSVMVASLAATGIMLQSPRARRGWIVALVLAASVPYTALWLPRFLLFRELGLHDTVLPLWAPALVGGSPILVLLYLYALAQCPVARLAMARVEGASLGRIWWQVALPQVRGATLAAGFLAFALFWGDVIDPLLYLRNGDHTTAALALLGLELLGRGELSVWMAGAVWLVLPVLGLILLLRPWLRDTLDGSSPS